jgi:hypothetical protein
MMPQAPRRNTEEGQDTMTARDVPDRFAPWPAGIEPAVPIAGYPNTWTFTPSQPASAMPPRSDVSVGVGLAGLAGRVESLGGQLVLRNRADGVQGAELVMTMDVRDVE